MRGALATVLLASIVLGPSIAQAAPADGVPGAGSTGPPASRPDGTPEGAASRPAGGPEGAASRPAGPPASRPARASSTARPAGASGGSAAPAAAAPGAPAGASGDRREMHAVRVTAAPTVDGRLDDPAWRQAPVYRGFTQRTPAEGSPATEDTEVRLVYDDHALYVGFRCHDREAAALDLRLGRRDSLPQSDWVAVAIDPYYDRKSGFLFQLNSAGIQADATIADGTVDDLAWDGVWEGEVARGPAGWTAELRIPFATLRFPAAEEPRFGVHVRRYLNRRQEISEWHLIGSASTTYVGNFETLAGLKQVRPGLSLSLLPYVLVQGNPSYAVDSLAPRHDVQFNGGLDAKYALTGQLTLDATINPDFGQVEVDPDVINLSAIETFRLERRPFFTEGAEVFSFPEGALLLHTRRIGAPPPASEAAVDGGEVVAVDPLPRIYGAAKVTGRVASGTSIGVLSAVVGPTEALEEDPGPGGEVIERRYAASPLTHFGVLRLRQQLGGPSYVGGMVTMVQRAAPEAALPSSPSEDVYVGALDFDLRGKGPYGADGFVAASAGTCDEERQVAGKPCVPLGGFIKAGRTGGEHFRAFGIVRVLAPDFDINDAGYQDIRDDYAAFAQAGWLTPRPWWRTLTTENWFYTYHSMNTAGYRTFTEFGLSGYWKWRSLWETRYDAGIDAPRYDQLETRYGRIPFHRTWNPWLWIMQSTNASLPVSGQLLAFIADFSGNGLRAELEALLTVLVGRRLQLQLGAEWVGFRDRERWIETVDLGDGIEHYVFNRIDYDTLNTTLKVTATIARGLTAQLYGQLLHGAGRYPENGYRELTDPRTLAPLSFPYAGGAAFTYTSLIANLVLRWEYRPLSTVYLVWTHASAFYAGDVPGSIQEPGTFGLGGAVHDLAHVRPSDVIMLKLSYLYQL